MLNTRWMMVLRELGGNRARTALVVLSIAVGVFAIGTIANSWIILVNDLQSAYLAANPASAVLTIEPFSDDVVSAVAGMRGVGQAEGRRSLVVKLEAEQGNLINLNLYAVQDLRTLTINQVHPESGNWPPARRQVFLERSWAGKIGAQIGDPLTVETPDGRTYDLIFAGYAHDLHQPSSFVSDTAYGYVTLDTLEWMGQPRDFNLLYITVASGAFEKAHIGQVVTAIKDRLERDGYTVLRTQIPTVPGRHFADPILKAILGILGVLGVFSLLLSGALVVNTISAVVARQIRQIGVMKAIGGRRPQILEIYLSAVAIYGVLSLFVAAPLALIGTRGLTLYLAGIVNFDVLTTGLLPQVVVLELLVGLIVPVIAALIPIFYGTRITVREAISDYGIGSQPINAGLLGRIRGLPATFALSLRNTFRRRSRLSLTLLTLTLAGAIFVAVLSVRISLFATFEEVLGYVQYDVSADLGQPYRLGRIEREALRVPGVTAVEGWLSRAASRNRPDGSESANFTLLGVPAGSGFLSPVLVEGRWLQPSDSNAVVVNTDLLSEEPDVQVGDELTLTIDGDSSTWQVVGIATTQFSGPYVYTTRDALGRALNLSGYANRIVVRTADSAPAAQAQVARALEERLKRNGILVGSTSASSDFIASFEARFNILIVFLLFMAFLLAVVGGLGLAGTMGLNVLERIREIGVMRAVGASDRAVQRIVLAEGVVIGVLSWLMGVILALPLSKLMSDGVGIAFANEPLTFAFSFSGALMWLALAVLIAAASSYLPARRASRLSVREILAYE